MDSARRIAAIAMANAENVAPDLAETALRLLLATGAAALIGWDREKKNRPAGLRTHMLVGLGACLFTLLALDGAMHLAANGVVGSDPLRVLEGVVGGVGFLGAGAILQSRGSVQGLTTAAGVWVTAALGVAAALGSYTTLAIAFVLTAITLSAVGRLEARLVRSANAVPPATEEPPAAHRDAP